MVPTQQHLRAAQLTERIQIHRGVLQAQGPGDVARDQHQVALTHSLPPDTKEHLGIAGPVTAEDVHGLGLGTGQVRIGDGEYTHGPRVYQTASAESGHPPASGRTPLVSTPASSSFNPAPLTG